MTHLLMFISGNSVCMKEKSGEIGGVQLLGARCRLGSATSRLPRWCGRCDAGKRARLRQCWAARQGLSLACRPT